MFKYILKSKFSFCFAVLFAVAASFGTVYFAFLLGNIIQVAVDGKLSALYAEGIKAAIIMTLTGALNFITSVLYNNYLTNSIRHVRSDFFNSIMNSRISFFIERNSNEYISMFLTDMSLVETNYFGSVFLILSNICLFLFGIASIFYLNWIIAITVLLTALVPMVVPGILSGLLRKAGKDYSSALEKFTVYVKDYLSGFEVIKGFNIVKKVSANFLLQNKIITKKKRAKDNSTSAVQNISSTLGGLLFFVPLLLGAYLSLNGKFYIGGIITAVQLVNHILSPIQGIAKGFAELNTVRAVSAKILDVLKNNKPSDTDCVEKFDFTDSIKFTDVNFSFKTNENDLSGNSIERQVLKNLNLEINTGEKVLLVGKTGSGKSTVLKLLLKYFKNYSGSITIDGKNLCDIKAESLYSKFGMIHQNVFLFDDTIENNIRLGLNFQDTEIDKAIKHSGLSPLIEKNPDGKKFKVGENGSKLSGGEKQRLAIARCLLLNLPVLILDEITSSLDAETAQEIEKQILSLQDKTVIAVSHRLNKNLLAQYNKIIVLQDGRVCECGTFDELIRLKKIFYSLYTLEAVERIQ